MLKNLETFSPSNYKISYLTSSLLNQIPFIKHAFFTRQGGVSQDGFSSLNSGMNKGDKDENVIENRSRMCQVFDLNYNNLILLYQEHGKATFFIGKPFLSLDKIPEGDGLITTHSNLILGIQTADCVPVLLADKTKPIIGAAHAGWKGALNGIIEKAIEEMIVQGSSIENIVAAIGPCIWQDSYEVSLDFKDTFYKTPQFFKNALKTDHYLFDLPGYVTHRLKQIGVQFIDPSPYDTLSNPEYFFSYRRKTLQEEKYFGNQLSAIVLK